MSIGRGRIPGRGILAFSSNNSSCVEKIPGSVLESAESEKSQAMSTMRHQIESLFLGRQPLNLLGAETNLPQSQPQQTQCSVNNDLPRVPRPAGRGLSPFLQKPPSTCTSSPICSTKEETPVIKEVTPPVAAQTLNSAERVGTGGIPLNLAANYIKLTVNQGQGIFEHEVTFHPTVDSRPLRYTLLKQLAEHLGVARNFDGVTLYLPKPLPNKDSVFTCSLPSTGPVQVKVTFRRQRSMAECVHFYNCLIHKLMGIMNLVEFRRNFYNSATPIKVPEHNLEVWPGYVTAVHEYDGGLMLCADVSFRVLRTTTVYDLLANIARGRGNFIDEAKKALMGVTVLTPYNNKSYRIDDICPEKTPHSTFDLKGEQKSFTEYYYKQYGISIKDPNQMLLLSRVTKMTPGKEKISVETYLVPELCQLSGLDDSLRKDYRVMKALDTHTKLIPALRERALVNFIKSVNSHEKARAILKDWGISISPEIIDLSGRCLEREKIFFGGGVETVTNSVCDWSKEATSRPVLRAVDLVNWAVFYTPKDAGAARNFVEMLTRVTKDLGIRVSSPRMVELRDEKHGTFVKSIEMCINPQLQIVVVIVPSQQQQRYGAIKILCSSDNPVPSQVICSRTISRQDKLRSVVQKIALQMNCKLGGELWAVHIPLKALMVCGIDVYHDPARGGRSVAAFVASSNATITRWYSRACYQQPGQELVDQLKSCFTDAIRHFYSVNHCFPNTIVVFRDGVGEGRLDTTARHEVAQLVESLPLIQPDYKPKLVFIVVSKRIYTRIFLRDRELQNPPPGTVVDHTITNKSIWDFFIVSQHVRQGTVSPTHYVVLRDGGMKPEHIQRLSYKLTHLYYNWPGTIRVPAPCQYADKLAFLVGQSIHKEPSPELSNRLHFL